MNQTWRRGKLAGYACSVIVMSTTPAIVSGQSASAPVTDNAQWGYGMGPGMMDGGGGKFGPGMVGGYGGGMAPGMMGGYGWGMGPGMMGNDGWWTGLDLSSDQQAKINKLLDQTRRSHWALMGQMMDQQSRLRDLYSAPKRDTAAIDETQKAIAKLRQQMYDASADAHKRIEALLTKEQQARFRDYWRKGAEAGW